MVSRANSRFPWRFAKHKSGFHSAVFSSNSRDLKQVFKKSSHLKQMTGSRVYLSDKSSDCIGRFTSLKFKMRIFLNNYLTFLLYGSPENLIVHPESLFLSFVCFTISLNEEKLDFI